MKTMNDNKVLEVTKDVQWIGVLDPDIVTFDIVMETKYGTTYNSYFINAEKKAIVESTKDKFWNTYLEKIQKVTDPADIQYIIVNHTEPDHSGNLANMLEIMPNATIIGSGNAIRYLKDLTDKDFKYITVKDGDTLDLGNKTLRFINAPNLHWPDSIYTYLEEDKLLFTCDSFGAHFCHEEMFDDKVGNWDEAFKYYFDVILRPYSKFMLKAIEKIKPLEINAICTGHGPILRTDWKKYVSLSEKWAKEEVAKPDKHKVFIPYVSAYAKTSILAKEIANGIKEINGFNAEVCDIEKMNIGDIDAKIANSNAIIIGSPTINQNILLQIYQLFAVINPIRDKNKLAASFGSYGWSGEAPKIINSALANLKLKVFGEGLFFKFSPSEEDLEKCKEFGREFATKMSDQMKP